MPFRCQAPECQYHYDSEMKRKIEEESPPAVFEFLKKRGQWRKTQEKRKKQLQNILRDWRLADNHVRLCDIFSVRRYQHR